ncbi:TetR family transcriptional regulator [Allonocardiopsis opalescens]|uniref:TetR family transcriptional regulator n=1 Tax=Allonocardiopsis opalescens TaxID=1144618 RepID=A0A2T0QAL4_9ACTN|nr:TetR family transcriptional regulator [Allonocardiopsis opalescens]PRY00956.1 TetR family transcriptional regulator [Allonocardiopsis opalescens]
MDDSTPRPPAADMDPEGLRAAILAAALPLVAEHGAAVTTGQIAHAAGIGEADLSAVFPDVDHVLDACCAEVLDPAHQARELGSISLEQPLADRLTQAAEVLRSHHDLMIAMIGSLHGTGHEGLKRAGQRMRQTGAWEASEDPVERGIADLLEPDRAALRLSLEKTANIILLLSLSFAVTHQAPGADERPTWAELLDVLLHGAVVPPQERA